MNKASPSGPSSSESTSDGRASSLSPFRFVFDSGRFSRSLLRTAILGLGAIAFVLGAMLQSPAGSNGAPSDSQALDAPRPISARKSNFLEDLTWMEIRDEISAGKKVVIVPTGGIEQSGPYLAVGKHNFILSETMDLLAENLGNALIAPIVKYVPEGKIEPKQGHMRYPGTISVREEVFVQVLVDIGKSLCGHGFESVVFLGDSGDNQRGLEQATQQLNPEAVGANAACRALFVPEYYDYRSILDELAKQGYHESPEGIHDDIAFTAQLLAIDENLVRYKERASAGRLSINGVSIGDKAKLSELGTSLMRGRAEKTAAIIRARLAEKRTLR